ncbi:Dna2-domain-containing protein [Suillus fuscotomentosus]|uniref:DNA replication ATP-dependent helicase/nuclease DNA2 n=1 Tax=Suillus fuscotomentosus TaxID=1912939 RepID=A0AAD4E467_9AGAM|nr:Dna2-domain-containing protein [Suillus fuscotomentosus]KAG1898951.1 Dna2-domain-containing protein [Suillus fuscotomentosus]
MEADFLTPKKSNSGKTPMKKTSGHGPHSIKRSPVAKRSLSATALDVNALLEGAESWDWADMEDDFITPKKPKVKSGTVAMPAKLHAKETCTRCVVDDVRVDESAKIQKVWRHKAACITLCHESALQILSVRVQSSRDSRTVILCDDWVDADIRKDILITATALSNAPQCRRKPLLSALVRSSLDITPALIWGNMVHEVMQICMAEQRWDDRFIEEHTKEIINKNLAELVKINVSVDEAKREVKARSRGLRMFSERYIAETPKADAVLTNTRAAANQSSLLAISQLHDVEEDIWSPTYGLKGKLDATVQAVIAESTIDKRVKSGSLLSTHTMPFEIKTGKTVAGMEHRAQTMLYTLLIAERYGVDVPSGLLYYTQSEEVVRVPQSRNELRALIGARNEMASYMMRRNTHGKEKDLEEPFLPPTIDDERMCKKCYALDTCMLFRKAVENVVDTSSPIADVYDLKTSHLKPSHLAFFKQWEELISLEEQDATRFRKELWCMTAQEREDKGRCFNSMVIDASFQPGKVPNNGKIHQYTYCLVRASAVHGASFLNGYMSRGDAITISIEPDLLALARGFILELTPETVVVGVDHELNVDKIQARLETLRGAKTAVLFRVDKDEMSGGMARIRDNLAQLFYVEGDVRRLELVVDLRRPLFDDEETIADDLQHIPEYVRTSSGMNPGQLAAMKRALSARDYALILGMPGTGKTTIIAALIRTIVAMGKTVLLTSYTHSAVDTILLKLQDADFGILRLGNVDKVHPGARRFTLAERRLPTTVEELENQIIEPPVVATTCLTIDQYVRNPAARKGGLETSLFRRLSEAHPHAVIDLTYQYRMNEDIMELSNKLIYGDRLRCGSEEVAKSTLVLPKGCMTGTLDLGACLCEDSCWLRHLLSESSKVVFVDTDRLPALDSRVGDLVQNDVEAKLVYQITEAFLRSGVQEDQIGIMSLYRQQIKLLSHILQDRKDIEILTADRSQGRDKDCIIISMVRSNDQGQIGDLLKDWRRVNVSFTRARSKLIIIGSRKTLNSTELLSVFLTLMDERGWMLTLPANADVKHPALQSERCGIRSPAKRSKENESVASVNEPLSKKLKTPKVEEGILKGRPILQDVVNGGR